MIEDRIDFGEGLEVLQPHFFRHPVVALFVEGVVNDEVFFLEDGSVEVGGEQVSLGLVAGAHC